jgi:hypothetical protein
MKRISYLFMLMAVSTLILTSCGKEEITTADPTISFQNDVKSLVFNGTNNVDVNITFEAEGEIESVVLVKPTFTGTQTIDLTKKMGVSYTEDAEGKTSSIYFFKVTTAELDSLDDAGAFPLVYTFTLTDKDLRTTTGTFTVTKQTANTPLSVSKSGMFYHIAGSLQGAYNLVNDVLVGAAGAATDKHMINTDAAGDPFTGKFESGNGTKFVKANAYDFANATEEAAITAYAAGAELTTVTPAANDIYIAKNGTTYFVIKITSIDPADNTCACGNTGKISFDYKKK